MTAYMPILRWSFPNTIRVYNIFYINQSSISMFKLGLYWLTSLQWLVLIPLYILLAPICMISSSLFDWIISWIVQDQTFTLAVILTIQWAVSALLIFQLIYNRTGKAIFFYQFVFFLVCLNFILIGITYTLLQRYCIIQEFAAKVCASLVLVLIAQKLKIQFKDNNQPCTICCESMTSECIILKCSHVFHESCLWNWVYVKQECPSCKRKI